MMSAEPWAKAGEETATVNNTAAASAIVVRIMHISLVLPAMSITTFNL
jgi:hypothetical protein